MFTRKGSTLLVALLFIGLFLSTAAAEVFKMNVEIKMKAVSPESEARGLVTIKQEPPVPLDRLLILDLRKLRPGSVYSVWLVDKDTGERTAAGLTGQNHFKTDSSGNAHYTDHTDRPTLDHNTLEVAYHPDGDPANTAEMVIVLTAPLHP